MQERDTAVAVKVVPKPRKCQNIGKPLTQLSSRGRFLTAQGLFTFGIAQTQIYPEISDQQLVKK